MLLFLSWSFDPQQISSCFTLGGTYLLLHSQCIKLHILIRSALSPTTWATHSCLPVAFFFLHFNTWFKHHFSRNKRRREKNKKISLKCPLSLYITFFRCLGISSPGFHICTHIILHGEGNGTLLQYSCLEKPMNGRAWYSPWGCKESDTTERLHFHFSLSCTGEGNG